MLFRKSVARLVASPLFTAFAVLSLAAGVAVTTAVYSVVDTLLFTTFEARDPGSLAFVTAPRSGKMQRARMSQPDLDALKDAQRSFERLSGSLAAFVPVTSTRNAEAVLVEAVDGDYFATVGVRAAIGRVLDGTDERAGAPIAVVSEAYWKDHFAAERSVLARTLNIYGQTFDIAGVVQGPYAGLEGQGFGTQIWVPLSVASLLRGDLRDTRVADTVDPRLTVVGRLARGVSQDTAAAEVAALAAQLDVSRPVLLAPSAPPRPRQWSSRSALDTSDRDDGSRRVGVILILLVGLVLVVACTNLANLVLARGTARQGELAVRMAMGASRRRLIWEQCVEGLLLSALGAVAAFVMFIGISAWMTQDFTFLLPPAGRLTLSIRPEISTEAMLVSVAALLLSLAVFGLEPAVQLARTLDVRTALAAGASGVRPRVARQRMIIRWQVAVASGFFIVATMFIRFTIEQARHDSGIVMEGLAVTTFSMQADTWREDRIKRAVERVLQDAAGLPAIGAVAASTGLPFGVPPALRLAVARSANIDPAQSRTDAIAGIATTPPLFKVLGIPIVRGRGFNDGDGAAAPAVAIISELAARTFFPSEDPVSQTLTIGAGEQRKTVTVVGVSRDTDVRSLHGRREPLVFLPLAQHFDRQITVTARAVGSVSAAVAAVRDAASRADADLAVDISGGARAVLSGPFEVITSAGRGVLYLGAFTLLLSMVGLFGVQSHVVGYRTREFGVRMSLGATARQIKAMVIRDGARPVFDGLVLGLWGGLVGRMLVRSYVEIEVAVFDPWMLLMAPVPIVMAAVCALYFPASRASRVDPVTALRCE